MENSNRLPPKSSLSSGMRCLRRVAAFVAASLCASAFGGEGVWTQSASSKVQSNFKDTACTSYYNWLDAANWQDGFVPTVSGDSAVLANKPEIATDIPGLMRLQYILVPGSVTNAAISGNARHTLICGADHTQLVTVGDMSGFAGLIRGRC